MPKSSDLNEFDFSGSESSVGQRSAAFSMHGVGNGISQNCTSVPTNGSSSEGNGLSGSSVVGAGAVASGCGGIGSAGVNGSSESAVGSGGSANRQSGGSGTSGSGSHTKRYRHQNFSKNIYIGTKNAEKWDVTRQRLAFKNDVEFVTYLLNLAGNDATRSPSLSLFAPTSQSFATIKLEPNLSAKEFGGSQADNCGGYLPPSRRKHVKRVQFEETMNGFIEKTKNVQSFGLKQSKKRNQHQEAQQDHSISSSLDDENIPEVLDCRIAEKIKNELMNSTNGCERFLDDNTSTSTGKGAVCLKKAPEFVKPYDHSDDEDNEEDEEEDDVNGDEDEENREEAGDLDNRIFRVRDRSKKKGDTQKTLLTEKDRGGNDTRESRNDTERSTDNEDEYERDDELSDNSHVNFESDPNQSCRDCSLSHDYVKCPFRNASEHIPDSIEFPLWKKKIEKLQAHQIYEYNEQENMDEDSSGSFNNLQTQSNKNALVPYSESSLPVQLEIRSLDTNMLGVFAKVDIPRLTRLGPLVGEVVQANDIREDCSMQYIFEILDGAKSLFISAENPNTSNWMRYVRVASSYKERNVSLVSIDQKVYFVTCSDLKSGSELLYWSDEWNSMWKKKHTEKTNCGGCNMKFDHPIYYRTHCSVFHDPSFSLTIRKYHCKVCGEAVLGKENIMKHAAQKHDGKGAYQCQFCKKFFLRLNYLEMHRTYGCNANPHRARPLCDFCGRKFCQPQKLKVHIKRMHSDMAEVLRDFQCKLCSKLLGSRAALQRHCKEVHSRNSTVVSCPRCQKLFQNRSNLKIHMLTHSGVRPFKCAEPECTAAFTTKQCLQFHYKKVHNYTQDQMPKIERSVAYTFDAYSGGMKVDFLEQAPRRRRKSVEDQNSILSSTMIDDSKTESDYSDDNIFETIKKSGKSIKDLCHSETNLSLLSSKISTIYNKELTGKKKKNKYRTNAAKEGIDQEDSQDDQYEKVRRKQNAQLSLVESFLSTTAQRLNAVGSNIEEPQKLLAEQMDLPHQQQRPEDDDNNFRHIANTKETSNHCQNLVVSKGSKKWISDDDRPIRNAPGDDSNEKLIPNRDFLARLMMNNADQTHIQHEEDENSTFLDVVDSNNPGQMSQFHESQENSSQLHINPITHPQSFISSFYNTGNPRLTTANGSSTSASMLVEAALNSVGSIIDNETNGLKCPNSSNIDSDSNINAQIEVDNSRFGSAISNIESLENEIKMIKNLNSFPVQIPPLPMFQNATNNLNTCNISPNTTNPNNNNHNGSNNNSNEIDVDSSSTPRGQHISDQEKFPNHHHTPPSPQVISPGRDYSMFASGNGSTANNNISPLHSLQSRRSYPEHELISPASSPSIPRYDFSNDMCRKRTEPQQDERGHNNLSAQNQISSDEENSIIAQNSTASGEEMRLKFTTSQIDLMYSKYDSVANSSIKYNNNQELDVSSFRNNSTNDMSDVQGLDMTSRANLGSNYHHNYQLPAATSSNLGIGRYHHHIYDILSEREQQQQQQHQQQQQQQQELSMQHQSLHSMIPEQLSEQDHDQATSVDLSRTANYTVTSPPALSYPHPHHDMLRMVSLDLTPNPSMSVSNNRAFLPSQITQHNSRESLDHHRLLSSAEPHRLLATSNPEQHRLLVDPAAHLLMEQNNRLLGTDQSRLLADSTQNRHMMSARSFGAYHQGNYHPTVRPVLPPANHHTPSPSNYHPFPAYY